MNLFLGWTREKLEAELALAQADLARGKSQVGGGAADVSWSAQTHSSPVERVKMLLEALNKIAPDDYPADSIGIIDRTQLICGGNWDGGERSSYV